MAEMFSPEVGWSLSSRSLGLLVTYSRAAAFLHRWEACEVVWTSAEDGSRAPSEGGAPGPCSWAMKQTKDQAEKLTLRWAECPPDKVSERDIWNT